MLYGELPEDLGLIDLNPTEMMFWMYCPIKIANSHPVYIPDNLKQFKPLANTVYRDYTRSMRWINEFDNDWYESYVYITAKTLWVSGEYIGNRPGWHSDGFGTDDVNYIWYDRAPTEFLHIPDGAELSKDCDVSMQQMEAYARRPNMYGASTVEFPSKHLLRLTPEHIHRCPVNFEPGMRTFVKISVSKNRYNLEGNSINHLLPNAVGPLVPRSVERNHPSKEV